MAAIPPIASSFDVELIQVGREFLVRIAGQVLLAEAAELQRQFQAIPTRRSKLAVLDLTQLTFISRPGVAAIVQFAREVVRGGGELMLAGVQPEFRDDFLADGLEGLFTLVDSVEEALGDSSLALMLETRTAAKPRKRQVHRTRAAFTEGSCCPYCGCSCQSRSNFS